MDLWSTSIVLRAGHRIRVLATSSNSPAVTTTSTPENPKTARPRPEWPASTSTRTPSDPLASSCR
ncbi:hypothetical protein RM704_07330 [Streptomyces sp. DSM 3412]|uniref:Xaa-Pro dipeptidyl-peptidase C-terminal domain-containing protein n=1 Tax=Streptomyces gottesmaniae TaxID=3075518 RepID=A0ABU2YTF2_9ACTN|nr:hypothetical protein [Streptomyces sp. DSM 3412]MDT0567274.1 hypothetical protein [Streptomyces sp. DSM 3412]